MTRVEQIRCSSDTDVAGIVCEAMPGEDCKLCKFREPATGRCMIMGWLHEEVEEK